MRKHLIKELSELTAAGIISEETSERIRTYYRESAPRSPNRLMLVFAVLGALLMGLGIILIIAHNWDEFSKTVKILFALLPLMAGQSLCGYGLYKKRDSRTWAEATSVFLFFAVAASLSMVSQVYHIPGNLEGFLLTWMLLSLPLVYVMRSGMTSLLVICGITWYACSASYFGSPGGIAWYYWAVLAGLIPFFFILMRKRSRNFVQFHQWFLSFSVIITLGMFADSGSYFMFVAYVSLFNLLVLIGETGWLSREKTIDAFLFTGSLGSAILLLTFTFEWLWVEISGMSLVTDTAFFVSVILSLLAAVLLMFSIDRQGIANVNPTGFVFIIFIMLFGLGKFHPVAAQWLTNVLVLAIAVITTWRGAERDNILLLNYGLMIMAALIMCRFFDTHMSFVIRGVLFLAVGISFFGVNYWVLKRRKLHDL